MSTWHYEFNHQSCGPVDTAALLELLRNRTLAATNLVWKDGMANWAPAGTVPELAPALSAAATPPPFPSAGTPPAPAVLGDPSRAQDAPPPSGSPPPISPLPASAADPTTADIDQNKVFAVLAYLGILFLVPLLAAPKSPFARYHTNQGIILFISALVVHFGAVILAIVTFGMGLFLAPLAWLAILVFAVLGIVNAASGQCKPLPLIGHYQILK